MSNSDPAAHIRSAAPDQASLLESFVRMKGLLEFASDATLRASESVPADLEDSVNIEYMLDQVTRALHKLDCAYQQLCDIRTLQNNMLQALDQAAAAPTVSIDDVPHKNGDGKDGAA